MTPEKSPVNPFMQKTYVQGTRSNSVVKNQHNS